jgi:hypothetical protein
LVEVGDIVLFRISSDTSRPLLVTRAAEGKVDGELFLNWQHDRAASWCVAHAFYLPSKETHQMEVFGVEFGAEVGQWQPKSTFKVRRKIV